MTITYLNHSIEFSVEDQATTAGFADLDFASGSKSVTVLDLRGCDELFIQALAGGSNENIRADYRATPDADWIELVASQLLNAGVPEVVFDGAFRSGQLRVQISEGAGPGTVSVFGIARVRGAT